MSSKAHPCAAIKKAEPSETAIWRRRSSSAFLLVSLVSVVVIREGEGSHAAGNAGPRRIGCVNERTDTSSAGSFASKFLFIRKEKSKLVFFPPNG